MRVDYKLFQPIAKGLSTFVDGAPVSAEEKTRLQHYTIFLAAGIPTMAVYGVANLFRGNFLICALVLLSATGLFVGLLALRNLEDGRIVYRINSFLFGVLIIYLMFVGGEGGSKILWMFTFPLIVFFLFGKREGIFWTAIILLATLAVFWSPLQHMTSYTYSLQFKTRFLTTYIIVSVITYWFEYSRYHYRLGIEEKTHILEEEKHRLKHEITERKRLEKELRLLASTDPLTGAANRRHFMDLAKKELYRFKRYNHRMAFAMMDIDHFKKVNDTYGHPVGDEVIKTLVQNCNIYLRKSDLLGRVGGEEFAILLVETNPPNAELVADRLRQKLSELPIVVDGGELQVTVSIGITNVNTEDESLEAIMKRADEALYRAKSGGRNKVVSL